MLNKKNKTVCLTGHRPNKLPGKYNWYDKRNVEMLFALQEVIIFLIEKDNVRTFITGGALGIDQMAFKVIQKLKKEKYPYIKQILAVPFEQQDGNWIPDSKKLYKEIKNEADQVVYVDTLKNYRVNVPNVFEGVYHPSKMYKRNEYMVDHSDIVISVFNGETSGGTYACVKYAAKKDKEIINIDPNAYL